MNPRSPVVHPNIAALRPTQFLEGPSKRIDASLCFWIILSICRQHADAPDSPGLLRACREG
jgi:hypothetical protein